MKSRFNILQRLLLLTTMLVTPSLASAQEADQASGGVVTDDSGEIVVLGRFIPEPMRETSEVTTFLSAADLARQGDSDAAAALTRLSGLSVVSGRFVFVRGLGDRYSSALLNGSPLPSPEPLRRTVPLDLFPSNILNGASVQKTFSPNYPGEFGGGVVDLRTVATPDEPFFNVKVGATVNTESTLRNGLVVHGGDYDWTGYDDGLRDVPAEISAVAGRNLSLSSSAFSAADIEAAGESLVNSPLTVLQRQENPANFNAELTGGRAFSFGDYTLGVIGVGGYRSEWRLRESLRGTQAEIDAGSTNFPFVFEDATTLWDITANALGGVSLGWGDHEIGATLFYVHDTTKFAGQRTAVANQSNVNKYLQESSGWYERELTDFQLTGKHSFGDLSLDWRGSLARSTRDAPYDRYVRYLVNASTALQFRDAQGNLQPLPLDATYYNSSALNPANRTSFSYVQDDLASFGADVAYEFGIGGERVAKISGGVDYAHTVRDFDSLIFTFRQNPSQFADPSTGELNEFVFARPDYLFSVDNIGGDPSNAVFTLAEVSGENAGYKGDLAVGAGYVQADVELSNLLRIAIGARYEDGSLSVAPRGRFGVPTDPSDSVSQENTYWLPAATLTWNFAEDLQLRMGYSETIARPQFRELSRANFFDVDTNRGYAGNPGLVDTELKNFDARVEYYFGKNQFLTGGVFYKDITNPIEEFDASAGGEPFTSFYNAPAAEILGAEIEYRINFTMPFDWAWLEGKDWLFNVNYTYTDAKLKIGDETVILRTGPQLATDVTPDGSRLQGQSENILNLQFGYSTDVSELTVLVNWADERVLQRGFLTQNSTDDDIIEDPGVSLDLVYRRDFTVADNEVSLGLAGRNLLDEAHTETQFGRDYFTYDRGMSFSASLTSKF